MPYVERVTKAGNTIEIERYFTSRYKKKGMPDIMLPAARAGYHGLYIELKAGKNTTTKKQKEWLEYLRQQGYYTAVCYGWQPAAQLIEQYLLHSDELTKEQETVTMR